MKPKPIIAITTSGRKERDLSNPYYKEFVFLPAMYVDAIRRAGGIPILVPSDSGSDWYAVLERADGVLVTGGADINPVRYRGDTEHPALTVIDDDRDETELKLVEHLIELDRQAPPALFICRGIQVLNTALGGTLHEHVADTLEDDIHRGDDGFWTVQEVNVKTESKLLEIMEAETVHTYSGHHQALKKLGDHLEVAATAPDGVIEAVESAGLPWLVSAVQWHPEISAGDDPTQQRLFDALVEEAALKMGSS